MSGGVDSSVAATLLLQQGYDVIGIMLQIWSEQHITNKCCSLQATEDAREVASVLNIPFYLRNYRDFFKETIVDYFVEDLKKGYTPNPCFFCNQKVRFGALLNEALRLGANYLATGHYVRLQKKKEEYQLLQAKDKNKDQSYMLHRLNQEQLSKSLFPLGDYTKEEVRELAKKSSLPVFKKKDSQDLCFLGKDGIRGFLQRKATEEMKEGEIVSQKGKVLGKHKGLIAYTLGQRRGLGIAAKKPLFVIAKNKEKNQLIVGTEEARYRKSFFIKDCHFISGVGPSNKINVLTKIRYKSKAEPAELCWDGKNFRVTFLNPASDITPGQGAVFYQEEQLIGGGIIARLEN